MNNPIAPALPAERRMLICIPPNDSGPVVLRHALALAGQHRFSPTALYIEHRPVSSGEMAALRATRLEAEALGVPFVHLHAPTLESAIAEHAQRHGFDTVVVGIRRMSRLQRLMACDAPLSLTEGARVIAVPAEAASVPIASALAPRLRGGSCRSGASC